MKNNYRCIWTSSYDRGLNWLLDMWPEIKKQVPQAELTISYGWNLFDTIYFNNPERQAWKAQIDAKMKQPGITHIGRIGQEEMVKELQRSAIWAYPTDFDEISCISAMKAQVYGAIPVTMDKAALKETVKFGVKVKGDIADPEVQKEYIKEVVKMLKTPIDREEMTKKAKELFSWEGVAKDWVEEFSLPKVYSDEWAQATWEALPKELQEDSWKPYRIS